MTEITLLVLQEIKLLQETMKSPGGVFLTNTATEELAQNLRSKKLLFRAGHGRYRITELGRDELQRAQNGR